ncbi:MAG: protein phosphatase 2C domain-containing protein [Alphaproteobacteria bacterium]
MTNVSAMMLPFLAGVAVSAESNVGCVRVVNEDCFAVSPEARLLVVADGVGGHGLGDRASRLAVDSLLEHLVHHDGEENYAPEDAVRAANDRVFAENRQRDIPQGRGMGTTIAGLWFPPRRPNTVMVFSVGDSRVYRLRGGGIERLTRDHSLYQEWMDKGGNGLPPARNIITRCVGTLPETTADISVMNASPGETFILCSDGLTTSMEDNDILEIASSSSDVCSMCSRLVGAAIERGGRDNVTVIVATFV